MSTDKRIFIKNIYYMLSYVFTILQQREYDDVKAETFRHIHNLLAAILAKGIAGQLKHGLYREYSNRQENSSVLRGKIDLPGTIKHRLNRNRGVACIYDELSENNLVNQIIKTTVMALLDHEEVSVVHKLALKKNMLYFAKVDIVKPDNIHWEQIRFHRHNNRYRMLIALCQLVLEGMLLTTEAGKYRLANFIDTQHMNRLYEKFIRAYYKREYSDIKVSASQIRWSLDDGVNEFLPIMQSDVMLEKDNRVLIIDAKYYSQIMQKRYESRTIHSSNLYQIFTYVKNKAAQYGERTHHVSGMLLYASTNEAIQPNQQYLMSGNTISVRTLDLNCEFSEIEAQLKRIVEEHF